MEADTHVARLASRRHLALPSSPSAADDGDVAHYFLISVASRALRAGCERVSRRPRDGVASETATATFGSTRVELSQFPEQTPNLIVNPRQGMFAVETVSENHILAAAAVSSVGLRRRGGTARRPIGTARWLWGGLGYNTITPTILQRLRGRSCIAYDGYGGPIHLRIRNYTAPTGTYSPRGVIISGYSYGNGFITNVQRRLSSRALYRITARPRQR